MAERHGSRTYQLPPSAPHTNHGKTTAAWTLIILVTLGSLVVALGMIIAELWVVIVGAVVIVAGLVAGKVMQGMGLGQPAYRDRDSRRADWYS